MRSAKQCPYRTKTIVGHNDRKNYAMPNFGINKRIDYDVIEVSFKPCIEEQCMMYDERRGLCMFSKTKKAHNK